MTTFQKGDFQFKLPSNTIICGPSSSGKTSFLLKLLENYNNLFIPTPQSILYCYGEYNKTVPVLEKWGIKTISGIPTEEDFQAQVKPALIILDDCMSSVTEEYLEKLFTKQSHHQDLGVVLITQQLFDKKIKTARLNSHYLVLMRSPSAAKQVQIIGQHLFPNKLKYFMESYDAATKNQYGYLVIDQHPSSSNLLRLRTDIFPPNNTTVFLPKSA